MNNDSERLPKWLEVLMIVVMGIMIVCSIYVGILSLTER